MQLRRLLQCAAHHRRLGFAQYVPVRAFSVGAREIAVNVRANNVTLDIDIPSREKRIFFINDEFTFRTLGELIKMEYPGIHVDLNFGRASAAHYTEESKIVKFLDDTSEAVVELEIDGKTYELKSAGSHPLAQQVRDVWNQDDVYGLYWYKKCLENRIAPSAAGTISHFIKRFLKEVTALNEKSRNKDGAQLSDREIAAIVRECISEFSEPIRYKVQILQEQKNELESEITALDAQKRGIEARAQKVIDWYIRLLFLASVAQLASFYYMIYHVDWLGWDIVEPLTYSVQAFTMVLGIRFFSKYRLNRDWQAMQALWRNKIIEKNKPSRDVYNNIVRAHSEKVQRLKGVETKINIYLNRRNYTQFM